MKVDRKVQSAIRRRAHELAQVYEESLAAVMERQAMVDDLELIDIVLWEPSIEQHQQARPHADRDGVRR